MTDNHPTAAPLSREQFLQSIEDWIGYGMYDHIKPEARKQVVDKMLTDAKRLLARPVPYDMTDDVKLVRDIAVNHLWQAQTDKVTAALDRIVAHLSPRDAAPSGDAMGLEKSSRINALASAREMSSAIPAGQQHKGDGK